MSIEWGENVPSAKLRKRLSEPGRRDAMRMTRTATIHGGPGRISKIEFSVQRQIRRYPLSSVLLAAGIGMLFAGVLTATILETLRDGHGRRRQNRWFHPR